MVSLFPLVDYILPVGEGLFAQDVAEALELGDGELFLDVDLLQIRVRHLPHEHGLESLSGQRPNDAVARRRDSRSSAKKRVSNEVFTNQLGCC